MSQNILDTTLAKLDGVKDVLTVRRVFGDAYQVDDVTIIPVAVLRGGGGGGGGEGDSGVAHATENGSQATGSGGGMGFGVDARPIGVYVVKNGEVTWQPTIDVMRIVVGGQFLALVAILSIRSLLRRRRH
jgi:uncharacterized spore protein YtfJ